MLSSVELVIHQCRFNAEAARPARRLQPPLPPPPLPWSPGRREQPSRPPVRPFARLLPHRHLITSQRRLGTDSGPVDGGGGGAPVGRWVAGRSADDWRRSHGRSVGRLWTLGSNVEVEWERFGAGHRWTEEMDCRRRQRWRSLRWRRRIKKICCWSRIGRIRCFS